MKRGRKGVKQAWGREGGRNSRGEGVCRGRNEKNKRHL